MDLKLLFFLMLMIVSIGIQMKILENGLLILWGRDSMWTSWDMHIVSVDQAIYATSIVAKYLDTATVKASNRFYKTKLPADMIFTKEDVSTSDE